jgi:ribonuclease HII
MMQILNGVRDSKLMTAAARESWYEIICGIAQSWAVGFTYQNEVDDLGIVPATRLAVYRAIEQLDLPPDFLITDYLILPELEYPQVGLVKGDRLVLSVSAASILAKVSRDRYMITAGKSFPEYGFEHHKGYGTRQHRLALAQRGPTPLHRLSFHPTFDDLDTIKYDEDEE